MNARLLKLYIQYLFGRCSREEFLEMKELVSQTSDYEMTELMRQAWEKEYPLPVMQPETKNKIKADLSQYIFNSVIRRNTGLKWWSIAAIAIILILAGSTIYFAESGIRHENPLIVKVERGQKAYIQLPDHSDVRLNAETEIRYDLNDKKQRKVYLRGEAFFKVEKDQNRPFIVDLGELQIEVLGTSFNAQTYENEDFIETSLVEGNVKLTGRRLSNSYQLKPMEQMIYCKSDGSLKIIPLDIDLELSWMSDRLVFNSEPLYKVVHQIERWYGVNIDLQCSEIKDDLISGSFYKEELKDVLEAIKIQYNITYAIKEGHVIITKNAKKNSL